MAYDPYYEQYQTLRSQEALTGRTNPTSPQALAQILQSNISADQDQQMKEQQIANQGAYQRGQLMLGAEGLKLQKKQATAQSMSGIGNLALGMPTALKTLGIIGGKDAAPALGAATAPGGAPTAFAPFGDAAAPAEIAANAGPELTALPMAAEAGETAVAGLAGTAAGEAAIAGAGAAAATEAAAVGGEAIASAAAGELTAEAAAEAGVAEFLPEVLAVLAWVLCSELVRQGKLAQSIVDQEWEHVRKRLTVREYLGYRIIADPLVRLMQRSKAFTWMIAPFIRAFAYEMASKVNPEIKGNKLGSIILWAGLPLCRMAYDLKYTDAVEVQRG